MGKGQNMRMTIDYSEIADTLRAAAHPERLAIMNLMWSRGCEPMNVKNIYQTLNLEQSAVSRHLGILKRCGLLKKEGGGNNTCYYLNLDNAITTSMLTCLQKAP